MRNQLGPIGIVLGAATNVVAEFTQRGHADVLWWNTVPVDKLLRAAGTGIAALAVIATSRKITSLGRRAERAEAAEFAEFALVQEVRSELRELSDDLRLYSSGRASLFLYGDARFYLAGRYSAMDRYDRCCGRASYGRSEGVLGAAWDRGEAEELDLPAPGMGPEPTKGWLNRQQRMGVRDEDIPTMTMKSRSYAAVRIDYERRLIGVIVVESELAQGVSLATLNACIDAQTKLSRLLDHLRRVDPDRLRSAVERCLNEGRA